MYNPGRWNWPRIAAASILVILLVASALDPAEALRGTFLASRQSVGGPGGIAPAEPGLAESKVQHRRSGVLGPDLSGDAGLWRRADLNLETNAIQAAFATELPMADAAKVEVGDLSEIPEISPLPTPEPPGWLLFALGAVALLSRAPQDRPSSRRSLAPRPGYETTSARHQKSRGNRPGPRVCVPSRARCR